MRGIYEWMIQIPKMRFVEDIVLKKLGALGNATTPVRWGLKVRENPINPELRKVGALPERLT